MTCNSFTQILEDLDNLRNNVLTLAKEAEDNAGIKDELEKVLERFTAKRSVTKPIEKSVSKRVPGKALPNSLSKYANLVNKVAAKVELVETAEILRPVPWESFQKYLGRVMESYGHKTALDVSKHMSREIQTRAVQERIDGGVPNRATREVWSRYFGISESDLDEAFPKTTKGASYAN